MDIAKAFTLAVEPKTLGSLFRKALSRSLCPELIVPGKSEDTKLENIFLASSEPTIALVNISINEKIIETGLVHRYVIMKCIMNSNTNNPGQDTLSRKNSVIEFMTSSVKLASANSFTSTLLADCKLVPLVFFKYLSEIDLNNSSSSSNATSRTSNPLSTFRPNSMSSLASMACAKC